MSSKLDIIKNLLQKCLEDKLIVLEHNETTYEHSLKECRVDEEAINSIY